MNVTALRAHDGAPSSGVIEIDLLTGARLRISGAADAVTVSAAIMALTGRLSGDSPIPPQ
jgi:hypothetical protein